MIAWGVAGVPILIGVAQSVLALFRTTAADIGLGLLSRPIRSVELFDAAAVVFWNSPALVLVLFVLIAGAWTVQGIMMYASRRRDASFASAGLASLLYFTLFWGVYAPLLNRGLPSLQLTMFFSTPLVASGLVLGSAGIRDWEADLIEDAGQSLGAVISDLEDKRNRFDAEYDRKIGDLSALDEIVPTGVERVREDRQAFVDEIESLLERAVATREIDDAEEVLHRTEELSQRTAELDPTSAVNRIADRYREKITSSIRYSFGNIRIPSRYDETYSVVNLPTRFREVELEPLDVTVHIDRLDDVLLKRANASNSLASVAQATADAQSHIDEIESYLYQRESGFAEVATAVEKDFETVREQIDRLDDPLGDRASELLVEGRHEDVNGVRELETDLADARERLHDCQFDDADRMIERTATYSGDLVTVAEFLNTVVASARAESERIPIPDANGVETVLSELVAPMEQTINADIRMNDGVLMIDRPLATGPEGEETVTSPSSTTESGEADRNDQTGTSDRLSADNHSGDVGAEDVLDAVLYVYRELESNVTESDDRTAICHTDTLPASVTRPEVLTHVVRFANRQNDLVTHATSELEGSEGFVEIEPAADAVPHRAIRSLYDRYRDTYT